MVFQQFILVETMLIALIVLLENQHANPSEKKMEQQWIDFLRTLQLKMRFTLIK